MPDLSHRPTRYATAALASAALVAVALTSFDVTVGQTGQLLAAERRAEQLREQLDERAEADRAARVDAPAAGGRGPDTEGGDDGADQGGDGEQDRAAAARASGPSVITAALRAPDRLSR
ncbi:MAG: hypothetical protein AVDCRST_MAG35-1453, partial [uncultured Quadrisphaera sp.]